MPTIRSTGVALDNAATAGGVAQLTGAAVDIEMPTMRSTGVAHDNTATAGGVAQLTGAAVDIEMLTIRSRGVALDNVATAGGVAQLTGHLPAAGLYITIACRLLDLLLDCCGSRLDTTMMTGPTTFFPFFKNLKRRINK